MNNKITFATIPFLLAIVFSAGAAPAIPNNLGVELPSALIPEFEDATTSLELPEKAATQINWFDANNDGQPDLLADGHRLYLNQGAPNYKFKPAPADTFPGKARRGPALCIDFDNDGLTDIVSSRGQLWHNQGDAKFVDVAKKYKYLPHVKTNVLAAGDFNNDGILDIFAGMKEDWNNGKPKYYPTQYWLSQRGQGTEFTYQERSEWANLNRKTYARAALAFDVDGDGDTDLFVGNYRLMANSLWLNNGEGKFKNVAKKWNAAGAKDNLRHYDPVLKKNYGPHFGHTIGACLLDVDNDGKTDIFVANLVHKYVGESGSGNKRFYDIRGYVCDDSAILHHDGEAFSDWRTPLGLSPRPIGKRPIFKGDELWAGCVAGDLNNDGWQDVYVPQIYNLRHAHALLLINHAGRRLVDHSGEMNIHCLDTYSGAWADVNRDGCLDLATSGRDKVGAKKRFRLYLNRSSRNAAKGGWISLRLHPGKDQRTPLGSKITVQAGKQTYVRQYTTGTSTYNQQNDTNLHFGLGSYEDKVSVSVQWPNGATSNAQVEVATICDLKMPPRPKSGQK